MAGEIQDDNIKSAAELVSGGGTAAQLPNASKVWVTAFSKSLAQAITDQDIGAPPTALKESLTLSAGDISAGYKDLSAEALSNSLDLHADRTKMFQTRDYTLSIVSLVTRITWVNDFASGGSNELVEGDILYAEFIQA